MRFHDDGTLPASDEIFVFGSNLAGAHGAGAALAARRYFGAQYGVGVGMTGWAYAIPTKDAEIQTLPLGQIAAHIRKFKQHARRVPQHNFFVTAIGCGLAGLTATEIAPLFIDAPDNCSFPKPWQPYMELPSTSLGRLMTVAKACRETKFPDAFNMLRHVHKCGTPACAFGNYAARNDLQSTFALVSARAADEGVISIATGRQVSYDSFAAQDYFSLDLDDIEDLFGPCGCDNANTATEAADYIENFVIEQLS